MRVKSAEFVLGVAHLKQLPRLPWPEIAWAGRSNVGKSSLINRLLTRKGLARTSNTPGKTRQLNFYSINGAWHIVDLPGYGFARGPAADRESWQSLIEPYLSERKQLTGVAVLVDSRHGATQLDEMMFDWLSHASVPWAVMLTKSDKISGNARPAVEKQVRECLPEGVPVIVCSATTGDGVNDVRAWVDARLQSYHENPPDIVGWQSTTTRGDVG